MIKINQFNLKQIHFKHNSRCEILNSGEKWFLTKTHIAKHDHSLISECDKRDIDYITTTENEHVKNENIQWLDSVKKLEGNFDFFFLNFTCGEKYIADLVKKENNILYKVKDDGGKDEYFEDIDNLNKFFKIIN